MIKIQKIEEKQGYFYEGNHWKVYNLSGQKIELNNVATSHSLIVNNCNDLNLTIKKTINHIEINNSKNIILNFANVISSIELTRSESCKIEPSKMLHTLQIDMCKEIKIPIKKANVQSLNLISEKSNDVVLIVEDKEQEVPSTKKQLVTFYDAKKEKFVSILSNKLKKDNKYMILDGKYNEEDQYDGIKKPKTRIYLGGEDCFTNWKLWKGKPSEESIGGTEVYFKIIGNVIKGKNVQKEANFSKVYSGTFNPDTNEVNITVNYSFGEVGTYTGVLAKNGEVSTLMFKIIKSVINGAHVGDHGHITGKTIWK